MDKWDGHPTSIVPTEPRPKSEFDFSVHLEVGRAGGRLGTPATLSRYHDFVCLFFSSRISARIKGTDPG